VWGVERIFDMGAFALMLAASFLSPDLRALSFYHQLREFSFLLIGLIITLIVAMVYLLVNLLTDISYALLDPRVNR